MSSHPADPDALARSGAPIYLADLDLCQPSSALSRTPRRFAWRPESYKTDQFDGTMLFAGEETEAPPVTYAPQVVGWHDVYVGMFNGASRPYLAQRLQVKLSGDPCYSELNLPTPSDRPWGVPTDDLDLGLRIHEVFFKTADLSGQQITFAQPRQFVVPDDQEYGNRCETIWIMYVKLVPLSDDEVETLLADRGRTDTKRLFAYNDSWCVGWGRQAPASAEVVRSHLAPFHHSDFGRVYFDGVHADLCSYFTKIGRMWTKDHFQPEDHVRTGDRLFVDTWTEYVEKGIDPFQAALDFTHEIGLEFHACCRLGWGLFYWPPHWDAVNRGGFWDRHPEWRSVHRDGSPGSAMSFAFPEVRRYLLDLIGEMAQYQVDGVCMLFNRQPPWVDHEAPLLEGFQAQYGADPRDLDERDPRWLAYRSSAATLLMEELRRELEGVASRQNRSKPIEVSAWVLGSLEENLYYGLDLETWVERGLVDMLVPYTSAEKLFSWQMAWEDPKDVQAWLSLTQGTACKLALNVMPRQMSAAQYRRKAHALYEAGVEHLAFWDTPIVGDEAPTLKRLGHRDEIAAWLAAGEPEAPAHFTRLRALGHWDLSFLPE